MKYLEIKEIKGEEAGAEKRSEKSATKYVKLPINTQDIKILMQGGQQEGTGEQEKGIMIYKEKYIIGGIVEMGEEMTGGARTTRDEIGTGVEKGRSGGILKNRYKGVQIDISGRLKGALRARRWFKTKGNINQQSFNTNVFYRAARVYTKWGTLGVKVYLNK